MQKSVFLPLWDNYELYGRKILQIKSFSAIESENLVRTSKFFVYEKSTHAFISFIINSYYTIIKYKIVVKKDKRIQCF